MGISHKILAYFLPVSMKKFRSVFLIDDDDVTNFINQNFILEWQVAEHVRVLTHAEEALQLIEEGCPQPSCPDLILLDLKMPVFDGFDFLEVFNKLPASKTQDILLVVLTSSDNPKDTERLKRLGIEKMINKPLKYEKMQSVLPQ